MAFKYRIRPTAEQADLIRRTVGCARFAYNQFLERCNKHYELTGEFYIENPGVMKSEPENSFLREVDKFALDNARINLRTAFTNFFKGLKEPNKRKKRKSGRPKFKTKSKATWSYKTNMTTNNIRLEESGRYLRLPKLGKVRLDYHRELYGDIKSVTVTQNRDGSFEVSILCDVSKHNKNTIKTKELNDLTVVGLDMSLANLIVSSEGERHNHPRAYRVAEKKLKRKNRSHSRKLKGSNNKEKSRQSLAKQHRKVRNQRLDFLHKTSRKLVDEYDVIAIESVDMAAMAQTLNLGKSVNDVGFGKFRELLKYKAVQTDSYIYQADKWFPSSQKCSHCGHKNPKVKDLSVRVWSCDDCGTEHDRDHNSAMNLKQEFIRELTEILNTAGTAEINACRDETSALSEMIEKVLSLKQEAPDL